MPGKLALAQTKPLTLKGYPMSKLKAKFLALPKPVQYMIAAFVLIVIVGTLARMG